MAGVGKGTLIAMLEKEMPGKFGFSVSHATRKPRPGEVDGVSYHFVTVPKMEAAIANGEFIEYAAGTSDPPPALLLILPSPPSRYCIHCLSAVNASS